MLTQSEMVRIGLETEILSGALLPGTFLDEGGTADRFNVSRTPVREAIAHLAQAGLVTKEPRKCAIVARINYDECHSMFEAIGELEGICAKLAAERMTNNEKKELRKSFDNSYKIIKNGNMDEYILIGREFHSLIIRGSKNRALFKITYDLATRLMPYRRYQARAAGRIEKNQREHEEIWKAISDGDCELAYNLMRAHSSDQDAEIAKMIATGEIGTMGLLPRNTG